MAEEFEIIRANLLPAAGTITDNDMILIIQGGRPKRALPSAMKGKQGDPGLSAFLGINDKYILWKELMVLGRICWKLRKFVGRKERSRFFES